MTQVAIHVDQLFFSAPGGIGTYIRELVPALARRDPSLDVRLFHSRFPSSARPEVWMRQFWTEELPANIKTLYPQWDLLRRPALPESLAAADIIHAPLPAAIPPASEATGQRLIVTVHDLAYEFFPRMFPTTWRYLFRFGVRAAVKHADAIITPSQRTADDLLARSRVNPSKVHVVPEAASLPAGDSDPAEVADRLAIPAPYLLSVGTLEPRKNLTRLVRAYRQAASAGLPHALVLAGPQGWGSQALLDEIANEGPGNIVVTGPLPAGDLDAVFRGASAFAYVSLYEGFGLPVLEAMIRGIPVVCSNSSSIPEVTGDAAVLVDPTSVGEIADALERVLKDSDLAEDLVRRGLNRASGFTWDEAARMTLEVYEKTGAGAR